MVGEIQTGLEMVIGEIQTGLIQAGLKMVVGEIQAGLEMVGEIQVDREMVYKGDNHTPCLLDLDCLVMEEQQEVQQGEGLTCSRFHQLGRRTWQLLNLHQHSSMMGIWNRKIIILINKYTSFALFNPFLLAATQNSHPFSDFHHCSLNSITNGG